MLKDIERSAAALYDGGWRAADREQIIKEYELEPTDAENICVLLAEYDKRAQE